MEVLGVDGLLCLKELNCNKHLQVRTKSAHVFMQCTFYATQTHAHAKIRLRLPHWEHTDYYYMLQNLRPPFCVAQWLPARLQQNSRSGKLSLACGDLYSISFFNHYYRGVISASIRPLTAAMFLRDLRVYQFQIAKKQKVLTKDLNLFWGVLC